MSLVQELTNIYNATKPKPVKEPKKRGKLVMIDGLPEVQAQVFQAVKSLKVSKTSDIAKHLGKCAGSVWYILEKLSKKGVIQRNDLHKVYYTKGSEFTAYEKKTALYKAMQIAERRHIFGPEELKGLDRTPKNLIETMKTIGVIQWYNFGLYEWIDEANR